MGWRTAEDGIMIGDGALDITDQYLADLCDEYRDEMGNKPTLSEVLACLSNVLHFRADEFVSDGETIIVESLHAKLRKRPKKQQVKPGDVFTVPLTPDGHALGRMTPQYLVMEFYVLPKGKLSPLTELVSANPIQMLDSIELQALRSWRWKIIGNIPYSDDYSVCSIRLGNHVGIATTRNDEGFIDPSSVLRLATAEEMQQMRNNGILPYSFVERKLSEIRLKLDEESNQC